MKGTQQIQARINRFRYGIKPRNDKRKGKRLVKMIGWAFDASIIGKLHRAAMRAIKAAESASTGFPNGGIELVNKERGEPIISRRDIAFIAPTTVNENLKQCQTQYN